MDGLKKRISTSLQAQLSIWLSTSILGVAVIAGMVAFYSAFAEANELQDNALSQIAAVFEHYQFADLPQSPYAELLDADHDSHILVQMLDVDSSELTHLETNGKRQLVLPGKLPNGFQTVRADGEAYRVYVKTLASGHRLAVVQDTGARDEIAHNGALHTVMPFLILVPILLLVVGRLVHIIFKPIADLSNAIDRRSEHELHQIVATSLPSEVRPFVDAINRLLQRVDKSIQAQQRFVASAAHELRTPLAALSLQAERLANIEMTPKAQVLFAQLRRGIERGRDLIDQLLTLARVQVTPVNSAAPVSVQRIFRRVLEAMLPLAEAKRIDLGVSSDEDALLNADELELMVLVKNLVDNAIRYTPEGGRVDLSVSCVDGTATVQIADNGPGIPEEEWNKVFEPFYRLLGNDGIGSGLGLSIVQTIAKRLGAHIAFGYSNVAAKSGLLVRVNFGHHSTQ